MTENNFKELHQQVWNLLPWYLTQTLSKEEDTMVEAHLSGCLMCRQELAQQKIIKQAVNYENAATTAVNRTLASLHQRIETEATNTAPANLLDVLQNILQRTLNVIRESHFGLRTALAAQMAMIAVGIVFIFGNNQLKPPTFETLTSPQPAEIHPGSKIKVIFAEDLTLFKLQKVLEDRQLGIVSGPSPAGAYQLMTTLTDDRNRAEANHSDVDELVTSLNNHPKVLFAAQVK